MGLHPEMNGKRIKSKGSDPVYLVLDGILRWIPDPATYNNLFNNWDNIVEINISDYIQGSNLSVGAILGKGTDNAVYLFSNGVKRWITSPAVMTTYNFNGGKIVTIPDVVVASVEKGADIN